MFGYEIFYLTILFILVAFFCIIIRGPSLMLIIFLVEIVSIILFFLYRVTSIYFIVEISPIFVVIVALTIDRILFLVIFIVLIVKNYNDKTFVSRKW